uniref:hydroxymethylbilane synthase n=1 Tax=Hirondellea gigas TaxID=1518452 RepID=A0A6A7G1I0_9CRUS
MSQEQKLIKIGSRDSQLAMIQTHHVRDHLLRINPNISCVIESMKTLGDKILDVSLSKIGSKNLFTKELEEALAQHCVHIVVHSLKDLPTSLPTGMIIGAVLKREDARDAVLVHPRFKGRKLAELPDGAIIGSSSVRRVAQLSRHYPGLVCESVRGNLNTRLRKLEQDDHYSAIVLAAAGVHRMGWKNKIVQYLESHECMHAVGQGALAVECLSSDEDTLSLLHSLCHTNTLLAAIAERTLMAALEGGCSAPVAATSKVGEWSITLKAGVWSLDGKEELTHEMTVCFPASGNTQPRLHGVYPSSNKYRSSVDRRIDTVLINNSITDTKSPDNSGTDTISTNSCGAVTDSVNIGSTEPATVNVDNVNCSSVSNGFHANNGENNGAKRAAEDVNSTDVSPTKKLRIERDKESTTEDSTKSETVATETDSSTSCEVDSSNNAASCFCGIVPPPWLIPKASVAQQLGREVANILLKTGAGRLLSEAKAQNTIVAPSVKPTTE